VQIELTVCAKRGSVAGYWSSLARPHHIGTEAAS